MTRSVNGTGDAAPAQIGDCRIKEIALDDIKGVASADETSWLRSREIVPRWYQTLVAIKQDVEVQLAQSKADLAELRAACWRQGEEGKEEFFAEKMEHENWRGKALHFKKMVEDKLREAKLLRRESNEDGAEHRAYPRIADALERLADAAEALVARKT